MILPPTDLAGCVGGMPDEDNDGRANNCDLCPADYDPTPSDSDGDGLPDDAVVKLVCSDGRLSQAFYKMSPRDVATGIAAGRGPRQTTSLDGTFGAAPAELSAIKPSYNVKAQQGARTTSNDGGWTVISLAHADGLCGAAQAAAAAVVKSKSNITNN